MLINAFERLRAQGLAPREAMTQALADSFMPIASSALTSVAGMLALVFMSFTIGFDIGIVLAKGIVLSMLTVFLLMPGVLVACSPLLDKTAHKPPHISGKLITRGARGVVPILLIALIVAGTILQFGNTYTYTVRDMDADSQTGIRAVRAKQPDRAPLSHRYDGRGLSAAARYVGRNAGHRL